MHCGYLRDEFLQFFLSLGLPQRRHNPHRNGAIFGVYVLQQVCRHGGAFLSFLVSTRCVFNSNLLNRLKQTLSLPPSPDPPPPYAASAFASFTKAMAARGRAPKKPPTVDELAAQVHQLQLENKELRKRAKQSAGEGGGNILTPAQKEALTSSLISRLTAVAAAKIAVKVRKRATGWMTKDEFQAQSAELRLRVDVSLEEAGQTPTKPPSSARSSRAVSRSRASARSGASDDDDE
ncbi:hypothetical protein [Eptesicus fuscus gammaherpesvirus]|uniref:Uncharacterized protein n=1 Tax=vespertilionid gammaherpesvirus 3 TaxID=2846598 RepID=A0A2D1AF12_9GAMA|nr:hypothetical protein [Eptesicus fuscus gammaherpesvirus]ATA58282.1 hypothetical protein [Eptesicus fuscus gammaherpesvirus]WAH70922.1 protein 52 [Eptesicus fuscus gammaherpesvirus]